MCRKNCWCGRDREPCRGCERERPGRDLPPDEPAPEPPHPGVDRWFAELFALVLLALAAGTVAAMVLLPRG